MVAEKLMSEKTEVDRKKKTPHQNTRIPRAPRLLVFFQLFLLQFGKLPARVVNRELAVVCLVLWWWSWGAEDA